MTSVQSPHPVSGSPLAGTSTTSNLVTEPIPSAVSGLTDAYALLEAIEIMHSQPDLTGLLTVVADYGTTMLSADGIAIIHRTAGQLRPMIIREAKNEPDVVVVDQVAELLAANGYLHDRKRVDDLGQDGLWGKLPPPRSPRTWRSLLIVPSEHRPADTPMTFVWWSRRTGAFAGQTDIAELFARTAGLAIHNVNTRDNLAQAVLARHRAGVAQGILMSQLGCSQDHAIAILKNRSQRTNRKLRTIADEVIRIGSLKPAPTKEERASLQ